MTLPAHLLTRAINGLAVVRDRLPESHRHGYLARQRALFAALRVAMTADAAETSKITDLETRMAKDHHRNMILRQAGAQTGPEPACRCGCKEDLIFGKQTEWMTMCRFCERLLNG